MHKLPICHERIHPFSDRHADPSHVVLVEAAMSKAGCVINKSLVEVEALISEHKKAR
jgi:hypothetical protein